MTTQGETVILDGGMGQELVKRLGKPATPLWSADVLAQRPDIVKDVHGTFLEAGAEVITLASYAATPERLRQAGREAEFEDLQRAAVKVAQEARAQVKPSARIAGCLPPLPGSYRPHDRLPDEAMDAEYERLVAVQRGGVDLFLCETLGSVGEARSATRAAKASGLPVWTALSVDEADGTRLRSGEPLADGIAAALAEGADAVLVNCSPPEAIAQAMPILLALGEVVGAYANGFTTVEPLIAKGSTVDSLESRTDLGPEAYADWAVSWRDEGAAILGGCCEVGPEHIAELTRRLRKAA